MKCLCDHRGHLLVFSPSICSPSPGTSVLISPKKPPSSPLSSDDSGGVDFTPDPGVGTRLGPGQSEHCIPLAMVSPSRPVTLWGLPGGRLALDRGEAGAGRRISENRRLDPAMPEARNCPCSFQLRRPRSSPCGLSQCGHLLVFLFNFSMAIEKS